MRDAGYKKITHEGTIELEGLSIPCYILEDGTRVLSGRAMQEALHMVDVGEKSIRHSGTRLQRYFEQKTLKPFIQRIEGLGHTSYVKCYKKGKVINGYEATVLASICEAFLQARSEVQLSPRQLIIANQCEVLMRGFARVGIIALVDEATGYQHERERDELQKLLKAFIAEELQPWQKTFPDGFYQQIFRLNGWEYTVKGIRKRPGIIGKWTNAYIYEQLPAGVLQALKDKTPSKSSRYHQGLTPDIGRIVLTKQIERVSTTMALSQTWEDFQAKYNQMVSNTPHSEDFAGKPVYKAKDKPKDLREGYDCLLFDDEAI